MKTLKKNTSHLLIQTKYLDDDDNEEEGEGEENNHRRENRRILTGNVVT
jgi:hypothetical protein